MRCRIKIYAGYLLAGCIIMAVLIGPGDTRSDEITTGVVGDEAVNLFTVEDKDIRITTGVIGGEPVSTVTRKSEEFGIRIQITSGMIGNEPVNTITIEDSELPPRKER